MTKHFRETDTIKLPHKIIHRQLENNNIFIAPSKASWIVTDHIEATLLFPISKGENIRNSILYARKTLGIETNILLSSMINLLNKIEKSSFHENSNVIDEDRLDGMKRSFHFYMTNSCNIRCSQCYMNAGIPLKDELEDEEWIKLINDLTGLCGTSNIIYSGGEPLLKNNIFKIANSARILGHTNILYSNGTLIQDDIIADNVSSNFDIVQISLDGATAKFNDEMRGIGTYNKIIRAISLLMERDVEIEIGIQALPNNIQDLEDNLVDLVTSWDYRKLTIKINPKLEKMGRASLLSDTYYANTDHITSVVNMILLQFKKLGFAEHSWAIPNKINLNCGIGNGLTVNSNGDFYPCAFIYMKYGNFRESNLQDVIKKIESLHDDTKITNIPFCDACDIKFICAGGCKIRNHMKNGDFLPVNCNSEFKNSIYSKMIERLQI